MVRPLVLVLPEIRYGEHSSGDLINIPFDGFQIRYASNLTQGDSVINISNNGVTRASLTAQASASQATSASTLTLSRPMNKSSPAVHAY